MRTAAAALVLCALVRASAAGQANGSSETLVGWSDDGKRYAVSGFTTEGADGPEFFFEIREGNKALGRWKEGEAGMPSPNRIDVTAWPPAKKFALQKIDPAARKKFAAELVAESTTKELERNRCRPGGWSLKKRGSTKAIFQDRADKSRCFSVLAGYVNKAGTHALIKVRKAWRDATPQKVTTQHDVFVLVAL
ncbi:MAG: hypothetical protein H0T46_34470 [Deltaproteobacteria bacterium]|nr:hypothetical protein [Deltaproteobacteria bacterium]